ncbi:MAG TPA: anti-sigma factor [Gemmatimonadales bacterium]|nr:anti-sigma factor [Gemmatimonadales bacterium]
MTDWLGMLAAPRTPRRELKGRVVARALARRRRWGGPLAAAAVITLILGGGAWWAYRTIGRLTAERDGLVTRVQALEDTVSTFIHGPATRLIQIPVSTGGRVGSVTIFADSARHRWLVRCDGLAPNARDQAYQLWFITDRGMATAALMPMDEDQPMVMGLEMPRADQRVMGAAMSIEPRAGSASPSGPMVFHLLL